MAEVSFTFSCPGCCGGGRYEIQCRSRDGTATLLGHNEFNTASIPPRKYRRSELSGTIRAEEHNTPACSSPSPTVHECTGSGAIVVNDAGVSSGSYWAVSTSFPAGSDPTSLAADPLGGCLVMAGFSAGGAQTVTSTKIKRAERLTSAPTTTPPSSCCGCLSDGANSNLMATSTVDLTLSDEDTESRAESRVISDWTEWGAGSCCAYRQVRGAGDFTFAFTKSEYRIRVAGAPGTPVNIELTFSRTGGNPFTETRQFIAQSEEIGENNWSNPFDVESMPGKTVCLVSHRSI